MFQISGMEHDGVRRLSALRPFFTNRTSLRVTGGLRGFTLEELITLAHTRIEWSTHAEWTPSLSLISDTDAASGSDSDSDRGGGVTFGSLVADLMSLDHSVSWVSISDSGVVRTRAASELTLGQLPFAWKTCAGCGC
jgi:hypothetical protein